MDFEGLGVGHNKIEHICGSSLFNSSRQAQLRMMRIRKVGVYE